MAGILASMLAGGAAGGFDAMGNIEQERKKSLREKEKEEALFQRQKSLQLLSQKYGTKMQEDRQTFEKEQAGILSAEKKQSETDKTKSGLFMKGRGELTRRELDLLSDEDRKQLLTGDQYAEYERSIKKEDADRKLKGEKELADRKQQGLIELEEVRGKYKTPGKNTEKTDYTLRKNYEDAKNNNLKILTGGLPPTPDQEKKAKEEALKVYPEMRKYLERNSFDEVSSWIEDMNVPEIVPFTSPILGVGVKNNSGQKPSGILNTGSDTGGDDVSEVNAGGTSPIAQMTKDEIQNLSGYKIKGDIQGDITGEQGKTVSTWVQEKASSAQDPKYAMFGEGDDGSIEMTLRLAGIFPDELQKRKNIADNLRKKFNKATEEQIAEMIRQSVKAGM